MLAYQYSSNNIGTKCPVLCTRLGLILNLDITISEDDLTGQTSVERTFLLQAPIGDAQQAHDEIPHLLLRYISPASGDPIGMRARSPLRPLRALHLSDRV